jgi:hypothetical protein
MLKRTAATVAIIAMLCVVGIARAQDADTSDINSPDTKAPPSVAGCWQGTVFNTAFCTSSCLFTLFFTQKGKSISKHGSTYDIEYDERAALTGVMSGSSSSRKTFPVKFHGVAFKGCSIHFLGNLVSSTMMDGNFHFSGPCTEHQFTTGDFSVNFLGATCP